MIQPFVYGAYPWCPIAVCLIAAYLVWGLSSGKRQKRQEKYLGTCYWEHRVMELARQLRENDLEARRKIEELQNKLHDERRRSAR